MKTTGFALVVLALAAVFVVPAQAAPPHVSTAHVRFERINPFATCFVWNLDLRVDATTAYVDYWAESTCFPIDVQHLTGTTTLQPGQVTFHASGTATITDLTVFVSAQGSFQQFTFDLTLTAEERPTVTPPKGGIGCVCRSAPASATGTVIDFGGRTPFTGGDVSAAEITQVIHTFD